MYAMRFTFTIPSVARWMFRRREPTKVEVDGEVVAVMVVVVGALEVGADEVRSNVFIADYNECKIRMKSSSNTSLNLLTTRCAKKLNILVHAFQ